MMTGQVIPITRAAVIIPWPGAAVRNTHAALLRAYQTHANAPSPALWEEVQIALKAYTKACEVEGIAP